jgi:hypothetical protein
MIHNSHTNTRIYLIHINITELAKYKNDRNTIIMFQIDKHYYLYAYKDIYTIFSSIRLCLCLQFLNVAEICKVL